MSTRTSFVLRLADWQLLASSPILCFGCRDDFDCELAHAPYNHTAISDRRTPRYLERLLERKRAGIRAFYIPQPPWRRAKLNWKIQNYLYKSCRTLRRCSRGRRAPRHASDPTSFCWELFSILPKTQIFAQVCIKLLYFHTFNENASKPRKD